MEYIEIGAAPYDENSAQIGLDNSVERNTAECRALIHQLRRELGEEPEGAFLRIKANAHDFGTYREVIVKYEDDNEAATAYAYRCEEDTPARWDDQAREELAAAGFPVAAHA